MNDEPAVRFERVRSTFEQTPAAAAVTVVNAALMAAVLVAAEEDRRAYAWLAIVVLVTAARLALWRAFRRAPQARAQHRRWSLASACGAFAAGLVWGGGSVLLFPQSETYQLFWAFLIGGMCAGAAALHHAHLPTAVAFILPACLPLAVRFALEGSTHRAAAAAMIAMFLAALVVTGRRSSRYFGEMMRLRLDLARRTRELDAVNAELRAEMAERRATEASLRHAQKMEAVGQLTGGIAHDFNNLLTAVLGSLALLRKRLPAEDPKAARLLDNAVQGAERGAALTQRLLAFGRRQALTPEVVDLPALVRGMSALLRSSLGGRVQVSMRFPEALPAVEVDANQLELALLNLAVNARDAMPGGGEIRHRGARRGGARGERGRAPGGPLRGAHRGRHRARAWTRPRSPRPSSRSSPPRAWARAPGSACRWCTAWPRNRAGVSCSAAGRARGRRPSSGCPAPRWPRRSPSRSTARALFGDAGRAPDRDGRGR